MNIGILAVQGDYEAHARMLERLGADYVFVRTPQDAAQVDAMILPGGESTTMLKFLKEEGLEAALRALAARGGAFFGTCAGAILLAREVRAPAQESLGLRRSGDHAQRLRPPIGQRSAQRAFEAQSRAAGDGLHSRALIEETGPGRRSAGQRGRPPGAGARWPHAVATFHPELTEDTTVHEYFLKLAAGHLSGVYSGFGRLESEVDAPAPALDGTARSTSSEPGASPSAPRPRF